MECKRIWIKWSWPVLSRHLLPWTEENHKETGYLVSGPTTEPGISQNRYSIYYGINKRVIELVILEAKELYSSTNY
jgi:hypothetical protein